jgi:hypothetical protein
MRRDVGGAEAVVVGEGTVECDLNVVGRPCGLSRRQSERKAGCMTDRGEDVRRGKP